MSYESIEYSYTLQVVNGFVQPTNDQKLISTRVTVGEAMTAIPNSRVVDLRYNRIYTDANQVNSFDWSLYKDHLVFQFPAIRGNAAYGTNEDYQEVVRALGL